MMTYGNMYFLEGKEKIKEKLIRLQKLHPQINPKKIKEVQVNFCDAEKEGISDGDLVSSFKITPIKSVLPSHFWFIMKNKDDSGKKFRISGK
jgi:hypothetical protein